MSKFKFELDDKVELSLSGECGVVHGRAEYATSDPSYYVAYMAGDGRQVMGWWDGGLLRSVTSKGTLETKEIFPEGQRTMAVIAAGTKGAKLDRTEEPEAADSSVEYDKPAPKKRRTKAQIAADKAAEKAAAEAAAKAAAEVEEEDEDFSGEEDETCKSEAEDELEDWETEGDVGAEEQADISEAELQEAFMLASRADPANKPKLKKLVASFKVTRIGEMDQNQRNAAYAKLESGKF